MNSVEVFLDLYRTLEEDLKEFYSGRRLKSSSPVYEYMNEEGKKYYDELDVCREVRNLLSHHSYFSGETPIVPSDGLIEALRKIIYELENPVTAGVIATPAKDLVTAMADDRVTEVLRKMDERGFSHVPVVNGGHITGVFSIGAMFEFMKKREGVVINDDLRVSDLADHLPVGAHKTEQYLFCKASARLDEIARLFRSTGPKQRRVAAIFVVKGEERTSSLVGMITPWDVIKAQS